MRLHYNPDVHHRRSIRLKGYDYAQNGAYFVTICSANRENIFGTIVEADAPVRPGYPAQHAHIEENDIGKIIRSCWLNSNIVNGNVSTDEFVIMPNHFHGIIIIDSGIDEEGGQGNEESGRGNEEGGQRRPPLREIIQGFKSVSARMCFQYGYRTIWQRGYWERVIRSDEELYTIRKYISDNPTKFSEDY